MIEQNPNCDLHSQIIHRGLNFPVDGPLSSASKFFLLSIAMRDNIRADEARSGGLELSTKIDGILQHRFRRTSAAQWARNLRFLTFAGDDKHSEPVNRTIRRNQRTALGLMHSL